MNTPEGIARQNIDRMLREAGWIIQDMKEFNPGAGVGIAVREFSTSTGPADYILFVDRVPVGVLEAKKEGEIPATYEAQTEGYSSSNLKYLKTSSIPFLYQNTGIETRFMDRRDPVPRTREVFYFHQPQTFQEWLKQGNPLRHREKVLS